MAKTYTIIRTYNGMVGKRVVSEEELNKFKNSEEYRQDCADGFGFSFVENKE